ncbi:Vacuolar ATPase assembly integral membrane protein [Saccharomyces cerevisiae]|uniref:Vacuolar ATPase assembly integral membrane protein VPH2 n=3 Tax=Saccharomyces cerevisiae TaxID=4932 RepID=VPH2_YEAST|nr:Vph2p [Saccharomyces cerevisiae S288C]P32341.1 RecName: Full=Vacuolar ATPase assembly integral membrane protein VPH2; AltName: Full=Protein VMA12 [Saccharomyces cerevisiae S288C]8EAT_B Chain B, Vacuolar ATPase assembly integral membrane protein VPH2 [Saccharomyces cerevisiae]AJS40565.1 Vph2p [Saccharomyces cerevisiae YJM1133]AJS47465.1 Vph2p [Saccharomyces cerevisiae YJM1383]AJS48671.1 Vph2p [Saccharomyces cerevisiae YJM1388]AJS48967.1 Vph2p [Saccharomyces cerevisiae YJM1389]AJS53688.1 Vp|eukprot:NP_012803.1 Vph2p [Saccharomyces cerevisiae S288C]
MFEIKLNDRITEFLRKFKNSAKSNEGIDEDIDLFLKRHAIPMQSLLFYVKEYRKDSDLQCSIKELLKPLEFEFKPKAVRGLHYSEDFKKKLEFLKYQEQELEYQSMVKRSKSVFSLQEDDELTPSQINKQIKEQVTTVFNVLVSVISVVVAIWYWTGSSTNFPVHVRLLLCLFFGILVLVADVVVYNSYLKKLEEAKVKEKTKVEKKKVLSKITL